MCRFVTFGLGLLRLWPISNLRQPIRKSRREAVALRIYKWAGLKGRRWRSGNVNNVNNFINLIILTYLLFWIFKLNNWIKVILIMRILNYIYNTVVCTSWSRASCYITQRHIQRCWGWTNHNPIRYFIDVWSEFPFIFYEAVIKINTFKQIHVLFYKCLH